MSIRRRLERLEARGLLAGQVSWDEAAAAERRQMARVRLKLASESVSDDDEHADIRRRIREHPAVISARGELADDSPEQERFDEELLEAWRRQQGIPKTTPAEAEAAKQEILRRLERLAQYNEKA